MSSQIFNQPIEAWIKWSTLCKQHFQLHFLCGFVIWLKLQANSFTREMIVIWLNFRCIWSPIIQLVSISSDYKLDVVRRKACSDVDLIEWHDDVIKWKYFPRNWPFVRGIHRSPVNSPHKSQWHGVLMFSLICVWINDWVKISWGWWFETLSRPLWRHCNWHNRAPQWVNIARSLNWKNSWYE